MKMGKKGKKERDELEEIARLRKEIILSRNKGDYKQVASLHNQLGYIYRNREEFEDAIEQHMDEARVTREHNSKDVISLAIAYRNIGEVYIDMKNEEKAVTFVKKYLKLAISKHDLVEEQRAHITLGRISLGLVDKYTENEQNDPEASHKRSVELANAQRQFDRACEILDEIQRTNQLNQREFAEMRCGTYLNRGITFDLKDKPDEAIKLMLEAVAVARTFGFCDSLHRCYSSLYATYNKLANYKEAYDMAKQMCKISKLEGNKTQEFEGRILEAKTLFLLNEMDKGINILKRLRKQLRRNESVKDMLEEVDPILTAAVRISKADDDFFVTEKHDLQKQKSLFEIKGDNYVVLGNFQEAIKNYLQSISFAEKLGLTGKQLGALYFSLAATYRDCGDYESALRYFKKEMNINEGNKLEVFRTQTNIADCLDRAKKPVDEVTEAYQKAIKFSKGFPRKQIMGLKSLSHYYKSIGNVDGAEKLLHQAKQIEKTLKSSSNSEEDDSQEFLLDDDDPIDLDDLSSAASETEDEEETGVAKNTVVAPRQGKLRRKNEKGETQLHIAAQKGDIKAVRRLLAQGHEVNPRDYSGWIPLHEACNFGHLDVVVELLNHKANVNDSGGSLNDVCNGITPIHDAASNGHIAVMKALLKHGASVVIRDKEGNRPVDALVGWYERERKSLAQGDIEEYKEMKEFLINSMKKVGKTYTAKDEQLARRKATSRRTPSPVFSVMRTGGLNDPVPVTIKVVDPDENEGRAGVNEYNEAISMMRRTGSNKYHEPSRTKLKPQLSKEALLAESQYVENWMISDDNLAPDTSTSKRKRDPFDDLKSADRNIRRRHEGKRNAVAQMDIRDNTRMSIDTLSSGESDHEVVDNSSQISNNNDNNNSEEFNLVDNSMFCSSNSPERIRDADMIINDSSSSDNDDDVQILGNDSITGTMDSRPTVTSSLSRQRQSKLPFKRVSSGNLKKSSSSNSLQERSPTPVLGSGIPAYNLNLSNSSRSQESTLRLKIEILGTKILVPVVQLDETIDWLCKEAANRYYKESLHGMQPTLTLTLKDGTILSRTDRIRDTISEFDSELIAKVDEYTRVASNSRFDESCKKFNIEPNVDAGRALTSSETTESLIMTDICLRGKINEALFQTIQHNCLRELNLSGCSLRDEGVKRLCSIIHTLVELEKLDISCNGLTHESLGKLTEACTKTSNSGQPVRQPIGIKTFILDHNPLGNSIAFSLFQIIPRLKNLKCVSVIDCNLTAAFFSKNKKDFISVVNGSSIEILDVSYNHLGKGGVQIFQTEIQSNRIQVVVTCCE